MSNPIDNKIAVIKETVRGVTPATPAFVYADYVTGGDSLTFDMKELTSDTMRQNRSMASQRKVAGSSQGGLKFNFRRDPVITDFLAGAFSASATGNVYKAGNTDTTFTIEQTMKLDAGTGYRFYRNLNVSKASISVEADGNATAQFDFVGGSRTESVAPLTGSTYTSSTKGIELAGIDVGTINIAGLTARYMSLELSVEQNREANFQLGQRDAFEVSTASNRVIKLTAKVYRADLNPETLFMGDTPVAVNVSFGSGANGYSFNFPAMVGSVPKDETSGSKQLVTIVLTAIADATGTDATFTLMS